MADILAALQPIFRDILDQPDLVVNAESNAATVDGWDSLAHVNLVTAIEKLYRIRFALGELQELNNVGERVTLIEAKVRSR